MKSKNKNALHIAQAKNLVRGALSNLRASSSPDAPRDAWKQEQMAQQQINKALAKAKNKFSQEQLSEFEKWVAAAIGEQNRNSRRLGTHITSLGLLPNDLEPRDLVAELLFAIDHLDRHHPELLIFAKDVAMLANAVSLRDLPVARSTLQTMRKRDGHSYWAVETELALIQATEGVEGTKSQVNLMSICSTGLNKFFLYYFGVRNEPAQTSSRFKVNLKKKIEEADISDSLQSYAKFRLYGGLDADQSSLAAVLAYEQLTTTIDLLFTSIKLTRLILGHSAAFSIETIKAARQATEFLAPITEVMGIGSVFPSKAKLGIDHLTDEYMGSRLRTIAYKAIQTALQPIGNWLGEESSDVFIVQGIASQLSTRSDGLIAEELAKTLLNFCWLPIAIELGDVTVVTPLPKLFLSTKSNEISVGMPLTTINEALRLTMQTLISDTSGRDIAELRPLIGAMRARRDGYLGKAISMLNEFPINSASEVVQDTQIVVLANFLYDNSNMQECLCTCAQAGMWNDRLIPLLPLGEMFQGVKKWTTLREFSTSVDLAIALDHYLRVVDDRKVRTYKRYAVEELLKYHGRCTVVELPDALLVAGAETHKVEYFFYHICDIITLELLPGMGESRKVMLARSQLLRRLAALHTKNELAYIREATDIEDDLQVNDGLFVLDDSKVYVDEQAVLNFVNLEMAADFQRYLKLVESGIGVSDSLTDVLKTFKSVSARTFQIPKNDADDLLAEIVSSIMDRFLFDPAAGLDIIIGRRIRHGTIASEIRGYLEGAELIGQKPHAGAEYDAPLRIVHLCKRLDPKRARFMCAAFSRFSESIDQLIALLRDEYFHVRTKEKSRGIFELGVSTIVLALARSIAQTCQTIEQFSKECLEIYWFTLSVRSDAARPAIEAEIKKALSTIFSKLTNELRALDVSDYELIACLQQASEELQRRAATIASWIRVPKNSVEGATYTMQRVVDVAVAMVTGQRPGFQPIITSDLPDDLQLDTHGFSLVVDALYIALDNICQHSGKKVGNNVDIVIQFNAETSLISFMITNEVAAHSRSAEKEARLNATRIDIQKRAYGARARLDRGSGLSKLAAIVMQSEKTSISFGYFDPDKFQLKFDLVYVGFESSTTNAETTSGSLFSNLEASVVQ